MITKQTALTLRYQQELHYGTCSRHVGPRGGVKESIIRVRVSGQCKTWKTRPEEFRIPVKHGLYENSEINHRNASQFHLPSECPALSENEKRFHTREEKPATIHCDQCQMLSINGVACHETGCPNSRKTWVPERGEWVRFVECRECGCEVEEGTVCCES